MKQFEQSYQKVQPEIGRIIMLQKPTQYITNHVRNWSSELQACYNDM